jgi:hypothetical protein
MRSLLCLAMLMVAGSAFAAEDTTKVVQRLGDRNLTFGGGLNTKFEGLVVALLGSCHAETTLHVGNQEQWDKALAGNHVRVTFAKPRTFEVTGGGVEVVTVLEILAPIGPAQRPDHVFVRNGEQIHAFSKFEWSICTALMKELEQIPLSPAK